MPSSLPYKFQRWEVLPDAEIWKAFKAGNREALEYIYRTYAKDLFSYGMKIKTHRSLVKDCIQELFVELWKSRSNLSDTNNIKFYLLKSLKLKIHHCLKKEMYFDHIAEYEKEPTVRVALPYEANLIEAQAHEERKQRILQSVQQLPARQQQIIHLLFFESLSYEEISEIMGIHVQSVYTLAWKSLSALKKRVTDLFVLFITSCMF